MIILIIGVKSKKLPLKNPPYFGGFVSGFRGMGVGGANLCRLRGLRTSGCIYSMGGWVSVSTDFAPSQPAANTNSNEIKIKAYFFIQTVC